MVIMKLKKGDKVKVTVGKDRGRKGVVEKVFPKEDKVLVARLNIYKKHVKPQGEGKPGGIIEISRPLSVAKVALVCPKCKQQTRIGFRLEKGKAKSRICKKCKQTIDE